MPGAEESAVGLASMVVLSGIHVPQLLHTYRIKSAKEISWGFLGSNMAVACLSTAYGLIIDKPPLYVANAVCIANTCLLGLMKCRYGAGPGPGPGRVAPGMEHP